jgi:hypothetical protein
MQGVGQRGRWGAWQMRLVWRCDGGTGQLATVTSARSVMGTYDTPTTPLSCTRAIAFDPVTCAEGGLVIGAARGGPLELGGGGEREGEQVVGPTSLHEGGDLMPPPPNQPRRRQGGSKAFSCMG